MPLTSQQIAQQESLTLRERYLRRALVALDQFANVLLGGHPDETISARSARAAIRGDRLGKFMCWWLGKIQPQHGAKAECGDLARADAGASIESSALAETSPPDKLPT